MLVASQVPERTCITLQHCRAGDSLHPIDTLCLARITCQLRQLSYLKPASSSLAFSHLLAFVSIIFLQASDQCARAELVDGPSQHLPFGKSPHPEQRPELQSLCKFWIGQSIVDQCILLACCTAAGGQALMKPEAPQAAHASSSLCLQHESSDWQM